MGLLDLRQRLSGRAEANREGLVRIEAKLDKLLRRRECVREWSSIPPPTVPGRELPALGPPLGTAPGKRLSESATKWKHPKGEVRQCAWCRHLLWTSLAPTAPDPCFHQPCWFEFIRSPEYRAWHGKVLAARKTGRPERLIAREFGIGPPLPPSARGRRSDPQVLTRHFGWAIRHRLGGEKLDALAAEAGINRVSVWQAIRHILELLPEPGLADQRMERWAQWLRQAAAAKGGTALPPPSGPASLKDPATVGLPAPASASRSCQRSSPPRGKMAGSPPRDLDDMPVVMTVPEVAGILGIGRNQAYQLVADGRIRALRLGRGLRVTRVALETFLADEEPAAQPGGHA